LKADTATAAQQKNPYIHCLLKAFDRVNEMMLSEGAVLHLEKREERKQQANAAAALSAPVHHGASSKMALEKPPPKRVKSADYSAASPMPKLPQPQVPSGTDCKLDCLGEPPKAAAAAAPVKANSKGKGTDPHQEKKSRSPGDSKATSDGSKAAWNGLKSKLMTQV